MIQEIASVLVGLSSVLACQFPPDGANSFSLAFRFDDNETQTWFFLSAADNKTAHYINHPMKGVGNNKNRPGRAFAARIQKKWKTFIVLLFALARSPLPIFKRAIFPLLCGTLFPNLNDRQANVYIEHKNGTHHENRKQVISRIVFCIQNDLSRRFFYFFSNSRNELGRKKLKWFLLCQLCAAY